MAELVRTVDDVIESLGRWSDADPQGPKSSRTVLSTPEQGLVAAAGIRVIRGTEQRDQ